jgi:hypothetical protein
VDDLIVFYLLEYHLVGVPLRNKIISVVERLVIRSVAWEPSQSILSSTGNPRGLGALLGISSCTWGLKKLPSFRNPCKMTPVTFSEI